MEVGNLVLAALVVGQILNSRFDVGAGIVGVVAFASTYWLAYQIMKRG